MEVSKIYLVTLLQLVNKVFSVESLKSIAAKLFPQGVNDITEKSEKL